MDNSTVHRAVCATPDFIGFSQQYSRLKEQSNRWFTAVNPHTDTYDLGYIYIHWFTALNF